MSASSLTASITVNASGTMNKDLDLSSPRDLVSSGVNNFPDLSVSLTKTAAGTFLGCDNWWHDKRTIAAGDTDTFDFGAGVSGHPFGEAVTPTAIKFVLVAIASPDGVKKLLVRPAGAAAFGLADGDNVEIYTKYDMASGPAGWSPVILRVENTSAVSVDYAIWVFYE